LRVAVLGQWKMAAAEVLVDIFPLLQRLFLSPRIQLWLALAVRLKPVEYEPIVEVTQPDFPRPPSAAAAAAPTL
jgi:hypothetical protein